MSCADGVFGSRRIEEEFQAAKGLTGLDRGQVTTSWHRWSMIADALPAVTISLERGGSMGTQAGEFVLASCRELVKLLRRFVIPRLGKTSTPNMPCAGRCGGGAIKLGQPPAIGGGTR
ncbi:hypothetical protein [Microtetraspora glauca]|uniref:Uncharacterized protein n=1 Tax=Microtetraspora glauca TaxID=1996 RepID=A0ABV3GUV9_MICGL